MTVAVVTSFAFYSASGSQLPHYALVSVPPLSILIALRLNDVLTQDGRVINRVGAMAPIVLVAAAFAIAPVLVNRVIGAGEILDGLPSSGAEVTRLFAGALWPPALFLALALLVSVLRSSAVLRVLMIAGVVTPAMLIVGAQPLLARAYPWERFGPLIRTADLPVWLIGPRAPSLTYYAARPVVRLSESEAEHWAPPAREAWIVARTEWLSHRRAMNRSDNRWQPHESAGGMTLGRWRGERGPSIPQPTSTDAHAAR